MIRHTTGSEETVRQVTNKLTEIYNGGGTYMFMQVEGISMHSKGFHWFIAVLKIALMTGLFAWTGEASDVQSFAGTWKGQFNGQTFVVLKLQVIDDKIDGTASVGTIDVGPDGEVNEVTSEAEEEKKIIDPQMREDTLSFKVKDGDETNTLDFKLLGGGKAQLKMVGGPPNIKPFKLVK